MKNIKFWTALFGVLLTLSICRADVEFTFDLAPFRAAASDIKKIKELRIKIHHQYLDKYFEAYAQANKINILYTPLIFAKSEAQKTILAESDIKKLIPLSVAQTVSEFKKYTNNVVEQYESMGRLVSSQHQTKNDQLLKELSEKVAANNAAFQAALDKVGGFREEARKVMKTAIKNEAVEDQSTELLRSVEKHRYILIGLIGLGLLNIVLIIYFYRRLT